MNDGLEEGIPHVESGDPARMVDVFECPSRGLFSTRQLEPREIEHFHLDGYVLLPGFFSDAEVAPLRRACGADPTIGGRLRAVADSSGNAQEVIEWTELTDDYCGVVPRLARLVEGAEVLLGEPAYPWHSKLSMKAPGSPGRWDWHQDYPYWYDDGCLRPDMLTCMIGINRVTRENGCVAIIAGSHRFGRIDHVRIGEAHGCDPVRLALIKRRLATVPVELAPGDACFFHANTLHASSGNDTNAPRTILHCSYNAIENSPFLESQSHHRYKPFAKLADNVLLDRDWAADAIWNRMIDTHLFNSASGSANTNAYGYKVIRGR